ncbi:MAG: glycosyltransferase family 2 protein [Bacteroidota bacterium]
MKKPEKNIHALIAVPAYNEEQNIPKLLTLLEPWKKDVIVIDDGSDDLTVSLARDRNFFCFTRESNLGLSAFYSTAKDHAIKHNYTHIVAIDGDGQHDPQYIPEFISALQHYDLVSGNRFHDISNIPASKIASNMFAILLFKKFLNIALPDVACGFRAMKLAVIADDTKTSQFGIIYEMLAQHALSGKQTGFVRIPATYHSNDPLNTKISEISGLLATISKYCKAPELNSINESIKSKTDFRISMFGYGFEAFYQFPDAYLFSLLYSQKVK